MSILFPSRRRPVLYAIRLEHAERHEGHGCPDCGRPLIDATRVLGRLPVHVQLIGALACPACRLYLVDADAVSSPDEWTPADGG